ncbi:MAG: amidohydrolase family protein [Coriobacteriia bacterium]|nr:amidohydrolase family protein [Coriobacteriia bacterium]
MATRHLHLHPEAEVRVTRLSPALPTAPGDIIDAHCHLFSLGLLEEYVGKHPEESKRFSRAVRERRFGRRGDELPDMTAEEMAPWYVERIRAAGISKALVVSVVPDSQYMLDFVVAAKGHIHALCNIDPRLPDAPQRLEREIAAGFKGVKLLPVNRCYLLSDPACRPFFDKASDLGVGFIIHYGVSVDPGVDMRYADPIDLSPVARDYPNISFVIAHFGAGYLDQVLRLAYQCKNVCVDTSGTNNWMDYSAHQTTLALAFERCLHSIGPERILFGTDAGTTRPYRTWIAYQQRRTLEELGVSDAARDLILRGNAVRIFRMDE